MHRAILPGEQNNIVDYYELCPYCSEEVLIALDAEDHGYSVTCPFCGAEMMLCTLCLDDGGACDWREGYGCFRKKEGRKVLSTIYANYAAHKAKEEKVRESIRRAQKRLAKLEKDGGWYRQCLIPLAKLLSDRLQMPYEVYGPFGLGAETTIYFFPAQKGDLMKTETYSITLHPYFRGRGGNDGGQFEFTYNTGETTNDYAPGSIGELNGFNNVEASLPDDIDAIIAIIMKNHFAPDNKEVEEDE